MSNVVRNIDILLEDAIITEMNALRLDLAKLKKGTIFHVDKTTVVATANGDGTPAKAVALVNALVVAYNAHRISEVSATTGKGSHLAADATNTVSATPCTDLPGAQTLVNLLYTAYNAHLTQAGKHYTNDGANPASSPSATDQASTDTRANDIKTKMNLHFAAGFTSQAIEVVSP